MRFDTATPAPALATASPGQAAPAPANATGALTPTPQPRSVQGAVKLSSAWIALFLVLLAGLLLIVVFRGYVRAAYFVPRSKRGRVPRSAWVEAGRRFELPPDDDAGANPDAKPDAPGPDPGPSTRGPA